MSCHVEEGEIRVRGGVERGTKEQVTPVAMGAQPHWETVEQASKEENSDICLPTPVRGW